jgi:hypothetical protein
MQIEHNGSKVLVLTAAQPVDMNFDSPAHNTLPGYWKRLWGWGCQNLLLIKPLSVVYLGGYGVRGRA